MELEPNVLQHFGGCDMLNAAHTIDRVLLFCPQILHNGTRQFCGEALAMKF